MSKSITCKNCGVTDLIWRKSAKGNFYIAEPTQVSTLTHGNFITIPTAHHCVEVKQESLRSLDYYLARKPQLLELQERFPDSWTQDDYMELSKVEFAIKTLSEVSA